jgi:hypothetical protein
MMVGGWSPGRARASEVYEAFVGVFDRAMVYREHYTRSLLIALVNFNTERLLILYIYTPRVYTITIGK